MRELERAGESEDKGDVVIGDSGRVFLEGFGVRERVCRNAASQGCVIVDIEFEQVV